MGALTSRHRAGDCEDTVQVLESGGVSAAAYSPFGGDFARRALRAALVATVGVIVIVGIAQRSASVSRAPSGAAVAISPATAAASRLVGADQRPFWAVESPRGLVQRNARQHLSITYTGSGPSIQVAQGSAGLGLAAFGRGGQLRAASAAVPVAQKNRVSYARRGGVVEWYANGPFGLEQGLTVAERLGGRTAEPLTFEFALTGSLRARLTGGVVNFGHPGYSRALIRYLGLSATDAGGRSLPARLALNGSRLTIRVDDAGAQYPITVDPIVQTSQLTATDGVAGDQFGASSAASLDGSVVVVGAPAAKIGNNSMEGAAYVFVEPVNGWASATQSAKLTASDGAAQDQFGLSVAVIGTQVAIGAPYHKVGANSFQGAVYVFSEPAGGWTNASGVTELTSSAGAASDFFGSKLAVSEPALFVGAPHANAGAGAVYEFNQPVGGWTAGATQTAELRASDTSSYLGQSLATSGSTVVAGAPLTNSGTSSAQGAAYVFTAPLGGWKDMTQTAKLTASDGAAADFFGTSVAVFEPTGTIAIGAPNHKVGTVSGAGAVYVFQEPTGGWKSATQTAEMTSAANPASHGLGHVVAITDPAGTGPPIPPPAAAKDAEVTPPNIPGWKISVVGSFNTGGVVEFQGQNFWVSPPAGTTVMLPAPASPYEMEVNQQLEIVGEQQITGLGTVIMLVPGPSPEAVAQAAEAKAKLKEQAKANKEYHASKATAAAYIGFGSLAFPGAEPVAFVSFIGERWEAGEERYWAAIEEKDPPDPNWQSIVKPVPVGLVKVKAQSGVTKKVAASLNGIFRQTAIVDGFLNAIVVSTDRVSSATAAGSHVWVQRQTLAIGQFATAAGQAMNQLVALTLKSKRVLGAVHFKAVSRAQLKALARQVKSHGPPASALRLARKFGVSRATIVAAARSIAAAKKIPAQPKSLYQMVASAAQLAVDRSAAKALLADGVAIAAANP